MSKAKIIALALAVVAIASCRRNKLFSEVPHLEYVEHQVFTASDNPSNPFPHAVVKFYFTDGDGNLGLDSSYNYAPFCDTCEYYNNLFIDVYSKIDGAYEVFYPYDARIKNLTPTGQNKTLEGTFTYIINLSDRFSDTLKISAQLYDRDLNASEVIWTPEFYAIP